MKYVEMFIVDDKMPGDYIVRHINHSIDKVMFHTGCSYENMVIKAGTYAWARLKGIVPNRIMYDCRSNTYSIFGVQLIYDSLLSDEIRVEADDMKDTLPCVPSYHINYDKFALGTIAKESLEEINMLSKLEIKEVIYNPPATIVYWKNGDKTVVKAQGGDAFDKEKGLAMAMCKRMYGDKGNYNNVFRKWVPTEKLDEIDKKATKDKINELRDMTRELIIECMTCKEECEEENSCFECAEKQLAEYEAKIKSDAIDEIIEYYKPCNDCGACLEDDRDYFGKKCELDIQISYIKLAEDLKQLKEQK